MNVTQNLVFTIGLVVACFLSAWKVSNGETSVGSFVSLLAHLAQLQVSITTHRTSIITIGVLIECPRAP